MKYKGYKDMLPNATDAHLERMTLWIESLYLRVHFGFYTHDPHYCFLSGESRKQAKKNLKKRYLAYVDEIEDRKRRRLLGEKVNTEVFESASPADKISMLKDRIEWWEDAIRDWRHQRRGLLDEMRYWQDEIRQAKEQIKELEDA